MHLLFDDTTEPVKNDPLVTNDAANEGGEETLLEWALMYAENGFPVLLLRPGGKIPLLEGGVKCATTDLDQIRSWFKKTRPPG